MLPSEHARVERSSGLNLRFITITDALGARQLVSCARRYVKVPVTQYPWINSKADQYLAFNLEFDPGSGRTLAAGLTLCKSNALRSRR